MISSIYKNPLVKKALKFAEEKHKGQFRKDNKTPYINHLEAVVNLLKSIGVTDENTLASAWLHDVIEDCKVSKEKIEREFNPEIAEIVFTLTRNVNREKYKERVKNSNYKIKIIKLADFICNCQDLIKSKLYGKVRENKIKDLPFYLELTKKSNQNLYKELSYLNLN